MPKSEENRNCVLAATNKMNYIAEALKRNGYAVEIVSASATRNKQAYPARQGELSENVTYTLMPTKASGNPLQRIWQRFCLKCALIRYLLKHTDKDSVVLVYHSLGYMRTVKFLKKIKKFKLLLEVEELYGDVIGKEKTTQKEEAFAQMAQGYIFPTELLDEKINTQKKPSAVIYGTYHVEAERENNVFADEESVKHLLYAGTFDPRKGGAQLAVETAAFLPENYHIHILGFGTEADKQNLQKRIEEISKSAKAKVTYDGLLSGEEYISFMQRCQVGLSTQTPEGKYNETSFPCKVLSYLENGLRVVSVRIDVLKRSEINDLLYYYDVNTPQAVAEAVKSINFDEPYDSKKEIHKLDKQFVQNIAKLLQTME